MYALRKCLSHTAQSEGTSQSCDIIVSMQHAHLAQLCVCVWWGDAVTNLFPFSNIHVTHLALYCLDFYVLQFERGESALVVPWMVSLPMVEHSH